MGSENRYGQWTLRAGRYFEKNEHNLGINLYLGAATDSPSINSEFHIGGYGLLTGLSTQARRGAAMGVLSAIYYQRYNALPALDGLIGVTLEYGGAWDKTDDVSAASALGSLGAFIGADTPLGTLQIGFAIAEGSSELLYKTGAGLLAKRAHALSSHVSHQGPLFSNDQNARLKQPIKTHIGLGREAKGMMANAGHALPQRNSAMSLDPFGYLQTN